MPTIYRSLVSQKLRVKVRGVFPFVAPLQSVSAAAQNGSTTGFLWLRVPPAANTIRAKLCRLTLVPTISAKTEFLSAPRVVAAKFTYTGTPSTGLLLPGQRSSADAEPVADLRTASTGMTVTLVTTPATVASNVWGTIIPPFFVASAAGEGFAIGAPDEFATEIEDEHIEVLPGEGVVIYQIDAGTAADTRRFFLRGEWYEFDPALTVESSFELPVDTGNGGKLQGAIAET